MAITLAQQKYIDQIETDLPRPSDEGFTFTETVKTPEAFKAYLAGAWELLPWKGSNYLHALYVRRAALRKLLGEVWPDVDFTDEAQESDDQYTEHLRGLYTDNEAEIAEAAKNASTASAKVGTLDAEAPIMASEWEPNPNSRALRGDPLRRNHRRII